MRIPSEEEIRYLVASVVRGEIGESVDTVITNAIWNGTPAPLVWGKWPKKAVDAWSFACNIFSEMRQEGREWKRGSRNTLTLSFSWQVILRLAEDPFEWWRLPGVTWAKIGEEIDTTPRTASYRMSSLGWKMVGSGMMVPTREIVKAPCIECGTTWGPDRIEDKIGYCCHGRS